MTNLLAGLHQDLICLLESTCKLILLLSPNSEPLLFNVHCCRDIPGAICFLKAICITQNVCRRNISKNLHDQITFLIKHSLTVLLIKSIQLNKIDAVIKPHRQIKMAVTLIGQVILPTRSVDPELITTDPDYSCHLTGWLRPQASWAQPCYQTLNSTLAFISSQSTTKLRHQRLQVFEIFSMNYWPKYNHHIKHTKMS